MKLNLLDSRLKRKLVLFMFCAAFSLASYAQDDGLQFIGKVKQIEVKDYSVLGDETAFARKTEYYYTEDGILQSKFEYLPKLEEDMSEYRDNPDEYQNKEVFYSVIVNEFTEDNLIKKEFLNERSTHKDRIIYHFYDENGNDTLIATYSMDNVLIGEMKSSYDDHNRLVHWTEYDIDKDRVASTGSIAYELNSDGSVKSKLVDSVAWDKATPKFTVVYDEKGRVTERYHLNADKKKVYHYRARYAADHLTEQEMYEGGVLSVKYTFDTQGHDIKMEKFDRNGALVFVRESEYNDHSDMVHRKLFQAKGEITVNWDFSYEYDQKGNWIRKEEKENGMPYRVVKRKITYY